MRTLQGFEFFGKEIRIQYARGKSDVIAKLDGSYKMPGAQGESKGTELQKEVFGGVPGSKAAEVGAAKTDGGMEVDGEDGGAPKGVKRPRDEQEDESDDGEGAPMEQDSDDAPMEEDSDEDE